MQDSLYEDWQYAVANGDTLRGYTDWLLYESTWEGDNE